MQENHNTKEALKMNEMLKAPVKNIPELAVNILQIYETARNGKPINNFATGRQTNSNSKELAELNNAKAKLHDELMQDFVWLHQNQQGTESLNKVHQDKLSQELAVIIKGYSLSYKGSDKAMSDSDRKIIAEKAYKLINSKEWQEELKKAEFVCKEEATQKTSEKLIENVIAGNLTQLDKVYREDQLKTKVSDFKGNKYTNRVDYLTTLVEDKEIMAHLKSSSLQKEIQEAVKEKEDGLKEKHTILNRIDELALTKQKTNSPKDALIALKREQEYLADLHNKLNPNDHSKELMHNIQKAYEADQSGAIAKLYKTSYYAHKQGTISSEELTEHFKSNNQVEDIHHNINRICYKYHCDILNDHCRQLVVGQSVTHQGKQFDCIVEYLEHWKNNVNHNMLPIKKMDHVIEQVERIRQQDYQFMLEL